ncbi:class I SAM-dependent methyltransferase [Nocardia abscessus]|uniref:class I SAM-dependent methyltransferase n=1 Tax=Nocardia abscessus TaxID=120957 RepID=UPI001E3CB014|nr:class I SAM-dependent methyltransferase [Nocardia abscessus]
MQSPTSVLGPFPVGASTQLLVFEENRGRVLPADPDRANAYDSIAEGYTAENETSLLKAHYERPAMLELAGDVTGRRIHDAECGSGPLFADLRDRGAVVTGIDASAGMLDQARLRLGDDADLQVADLADTLPFADDTFDDVVASLVLHYLQDWGPTLAELRRGLAPGGRLIASVEHPFATFLHQRLTREETNYFQTRHRIAEWTMGGQTARLSFWDRPLHAMIDAFTAAGFRISVISEAPALPSAQDLAPRSIRRDHRHEVLVLPVLRPACRLTTAPRRCHKRDGLKMNRHGWGAASFLEEDGHHAEALPARGTGEVPASGSRLPR